MDIFLHLTANNPYELKQPKVLVNYKGTKAVQWTLNEGEGSV